MGYKFSIKFKRKKMNYFIVVRKNNPYNDFEQNEREFWFRDKNKTDGLRKYPQVYTQINIGDTLLCYYANRKMGYFCAILEADKKHKNDGEYGIDFIFKEQIYIPFETIKAHYNEILNSYKGKYSAFTKSKTMKNCFYGTFFQSNAEQFDLICNLNSKN